MKLSLLTYTALAACLILGFFRQDVRAQGILGGTPEQVVVDAENTTARILNFRTGDVIVPAAPFYSVLTDELFIQGEFQELPWYMTTGDLIVLVNGVNISQYPTGSFAVDAATQSAAFSLWLPMPGSWELPLSDVKVELVYVQHDQAIARTTVSLYDFRYPNGAALVDGSSTSEFGLNYQMTDYGLGGAGNGDPTGIEELVFAEYPSPSTESFNELLGEYVSNLASREDTGLKRCIDYEDLETEEFKQVTEFPAYNTANAQAWFVYGLYSLCVSQGGGAACDASCVQAAPKANDFELCVDTITGEPTTGSVGDFRDLELSFVTSASPGLIEADMRFGDFEANVDMHLSDLHVRWKASGCVGRPNVQLDDAEIAQRVWLADWATCVGTEITADTGLTRHVDGIPPQYAINIDSTNAHLLYISDFQLAEFGFQQVEHDAAMGTCALDFIANEADTLLSQFVDDALSTLADTVNDGQPETDMSVLLDQAFLTVAIGETETQLYEINANVNSVSTSDVFGLIVDWETQIEVLNAADVARLRPTFVEQGLMSSRFVENSEDLLGNTISSKFGLRTAWLNEALWARAATHIFDQPLAFSEVELGIGTSTEPLITQFDGQSLVDVYPEFADLAGTQVEIYVQRQLDPLVFQPIDPQVATPDVGWPLHFGMTGLRVYIKGLDKDNGSGIERGPSYVTLDLNMFESEFSMISSFVREDDFVSPLISYPGWQLNVLDMDFPTCPKFSHESIPNRIGSCEADLEAALHNFLAVKLDALLAQVLDEIPAPQYFNIENGSGLEVQTDNQSRLHQFGTVHILDLLAQPAP